MATNIATADALLTVYLEYLQEVITMANSHISTISSTLKHETLVRNEWHDFPMRPSILLKFCSTNVFDKTCGPLFVC